MQNGQGPFGFETFLGFHGVFIWDKAFRVGSGALFALGFRLFRLPHCTFASEFFTRLSMATGTSDLSFPPTTLWGDKFEVISSFLFH